MLEFIKKLFIKLFGKKEKGEMIDIPTDEDSQVITPEFDEVEKETPEDREVEIVKEDVKEEPAVHETAENSATTNAETIEENVSESPTEEIIPEPVEPKTFNARTDLPAGNVQPIDVFSLALTYLGVKDVTVSSQSFTVVSVMCDKDGRVVRAYEDYAGVIGEAGASYNSRNLSDRWKKFSRGVLNLNMSKSEVDAMIADARERGIYFYGDDHPYNPNTI